MMDSEFYYLFLPLLAFVVVVPLVGLHEWKKERENSSSEPITMYIRYPDHTVEEMRVADRYEVQNALTEHLTKKLAEEPGTDVSLMLVYWLSLDGFAYLRLYSVDQNPGGVPLLWTAVTSSIDFQWDHQPPALKNPDVQLDAICALGCRLQDAKQNMPSESNMPRNIDNIKEMIYHNEKRKI